MFSYQHRYHAGCFADVHKHLCLIALLNHFRKKDTPFCVLDAYAGEGIYDLHCEESEKNAEYKKGILPVLKAYQPPTLVEQLKNIISIAGKEVYPGSPQIILSSLREQDRAIFIEHHPQAVIELRRNFHQYPQCHIHDRDAIEGMKALIPFKEKRGLVFIDPSYEVKSEYQTIALAVSTSIKSFPQGCFAIWYPILKEEYHLSLIKSIKQLALEKTWHCEWVPYPEETTGMLGSGLIIINTPFQVNEVITENMQWLNKQIFRKGKFVAGNL